MSKQHYSDRHLSALRRFALAITVLNILGHTVLGFEASYVQPLVALATAYSMQMLLELIDAWSSQRTPRFLGGFVALVNFLLSPHITALATAMLLYYNDNLWVVAFAVAVAIGSKSIFRVPVGQGTRHIINPSNFGISVTLLVFPSMVGLVMPWQFTQDIGGTLGWCLVGTIFVLGTYLNTVYTRRLPLIMAFVVGFVSQVVVRWLLLGHNPISALAPVTGVAALLYTFYMAPDPATTPDSFWGQVAFGAAIPAVYLVFVSLHVVFGLFFALTIVCAARGIGLFAIAMMAHRPPALERGWAGSGSLAQ